MTLQNRVLPTGDIVAIPDRGMFMGNRGILHDDRQLLGRARWRHGNWICCVLSFKGRRRQVMARGTYTELFFMDEAVALAAGHRPCAECRRVDYNAFRAAWAVAFGVVPRAAEIDAVLHAARVESHNKQQVRHVADADGLPDGTFILSSDVPMLVQGDALRPWTAAGYLGPVTRPVGPVTVLTPRPLVAVLAAGFCPQMHLSAHR